MGFPDRRGIAAGLGVWLATLAAFAMQLDAPWWAAMSAYRISNPDQRVLLSLGANRILGTLAGCLLGYWAAVALEDISPAQVLLLFVVIAYTSYKRFVSRYAYAWVLMGITFVLIMVSSFEDTAEILLITYYRGYEILVGVIVMMLVDAVLMHPVRGQLAGPQQPRPDRDALYDITKAALLGGLAVVVIPLIWYWMDLPSVVQAVVTAIAILELNFASTRWKALMRISGCLVGGGAGLLVAALGIESLWLWSLFFLAGMTMASQLHHSKSRYSYLGTQAGFGFIFAMITGPGPPDSIVPAVDRLVGITVGLVILIVLYLMIDSLFPSRRKES